MANVLTNHNSFHIAEVAGFALTYIYEVYIKYKVCLFIHVNTKWFELVLPSNWYSKPNNMGCSENSLETKISKT